jgi:hypothetical protein
VRLWGCETVGLWDCGNVGLWNCETEAVMLWDCETVGLRVCGSVGLWDCRAVGTVGLWGCDSPLEQTLDVSPGRPLSVPLSCPSLSSAPRQCTDRSRGPSPLEAGELQGERGPLARMSVIMKRDLVACGWCAEASGLPLLPIVISSTVIPPAPPRPVLVSSTITIRHTSLTHHHDSPAVV